MSESQEFTPADAVEFVAQPQWNTTNERQNGTSQPDGILNPTLSEDEQRHREQVVSQSGKVVESLAGEINRESNAIRTSPEAGIKSVALGRVLGSYEKGNSGVEVHEVEGEVLNQLGISAEVSSAYDALLQRYMQDTRSQSQPTAPYKMTIPLDPQRLKELGVQIDDNQKAGYTIALRVNNADPRRTTVENSITLSSS